jgi:RNA recognition motif-containing protein
VCLYCLIFLANDGCSNENALAEIGKNSDDSSDEDEPPEPDTTLFIKNLNFSTEQEDIREVSIQFIISQHLVAHATLRSDKMKI